MEPTQANPIEKRRRLIVAVVLVLVSLMLSWWYWPRGDARFVGTWAVTFEHDPTVRTLVLNSDGSGFWDLEPPVHFPWVADDKHLSLGVHSRPQMFWEVHDLVGSVTGYERYTRISDLHMILTLKPDHIRTHMDNVRFAATNEPFVAIFTRIPE